MKTYEKNERLMRRYEEEDLPAYQQWVRTQFGELLAEMRSVQEEIMYEETVRRIVEAIRLRRGLSAQEAYRVFIAHEKVGESADEGEGTHAGDAARDADPDDTFARPYGAEDAVPGREPATDPGGKDTVREKYRKLCRLLHPDAAGDMTEEKKRLWLEAKSAYARADGERLDELLARALMGGGDALHMDSASALQEVTHYFRRAAQSVRNLLRHAKKTAAWTFASLTERQRDRMAQQARRDLDLKLRDMRRHRDDLVAQRKRDYESSDSKRTFRR